MADARREYLAVPPLGDECPRCRRRPRARRLIVRWRRRPVCRPCQEELDNAAAAAFLWALATMAAERAAGRPTVARLLGKDADDG